MSVIFIAGIYGVGKTTLSNKLSNRLNIKSYTASQLIYNNIKNIMNKEVIDVNENQNKLEIEVNKLINVSKNIILDGHFCILDKNKRITRIPQSTFINLKLSIIILLSLPVNIIFNRIEKRDNKKYSMELLLRLQEDEIKYAYETADFLNVPMYHYTSENHFFDLEKTISTMLIKD